ncbi:hypothetical protein AArcSl_1288 [Halalkaliarchaeum desulfuricum]|uniref:Uncharacterized protein n=1 Tax=Halalkaliarchaeum desulfuricum TaxID=2055893 RepID=A0A343TIJ7_9EURY|nr:hypothetical protein [Halalkaliarchaeum desulfuricum]AUX08919.1 hypothetical protein AArcSl_1288 [Halalkaliarchaeum desulfuricum]
MSTATSEDTVEHTAGASRPTGIARCEELEGQSEPYTVHGVAIGANEVTHGANGPKFWPSDELRQAVQSLVGVPLTKNHDDDRVESVVGEVIDAGFEPGVGIVFEAEVDDEDLATKIARGRLEVSVHALHRDGGRTGEGELIVEDVQFLDLSLVPRGGSPSNFVEAGESPSEVLASLSTDEVAEILDDADSGSDTTNHESMTDDTDDTEQEEAIEADESETEAEDTEEAEVEADEAEVEETEAEVEADEAEVEDTEEAEAEAEEADADADLEEAELREELESLRAENQELRKELQSVRLEYAGQLSEGTPFEAAELAEKFSFDELREKFDEAEASLVSDEDTSEAEATPAPQTGDAESELSTSDDEDVESEIAALESKIENYDELGWDAAKADAEERLEELRS